MAHVHLDKPRVHCAVSKNGFGLDSMVCQNAALAPWLDADAEGFTDRSSLWTPSRHPVDLAVGAPKRRSGGPALGQCAQRPDFPQGDLGTARVQFYEWGVMRQLAVRPKFRVVPDPFEAL